MNSEKSNRKCDDGYCGWDKRKTFVNCLENE